MRSFFVIPLLTTDDGPNNIHVLIDYDSDGESSPSLRFVSGINEFTIHGMDFRDIADLGQFLINRAGELKDRTENKEKINARSSSQVLQKSQGHESLQSPDVRPDS